MLGCVSNAGCYQRALGAYGKDISHNEEKEQMRCSGKRGVWRDSSFFFLSNMLAAE